MKKYFRKASAAILAALILCASGCEFASDQINDIHSTVSEAGSSAVTSSESVESEPYSSNAESLEAVESEVTSSEANSSNAESSNFDISDMRIPDVSVPNVSIPDIVVSDFGTPNSQSKSSSIASSESSSQNTSSEKSDSSSSSSSSLFSDKTQTIGNSDIGYLDIPSNFVEFYDIVPNTDLQYSDTSGTIIFTLNTVGSAAEGESAIEQKAQMVESNMKQGGAADTTQAKMKVAGKYDATQVYGYWAEDDSFLLVDLFEADGKIIYLAVEFPYEYADIVDYLDTYRYSDDSQI